ncbi:MAG: UdgX family uracil-DNA binding protein [Planctomycetota bacterium]
MAGRRRITLDGSLEHWRAHVRELVREGVAPTDVEWVDPLRSPQDGGALFASLEAPRPTPPRDVPPLSLPKALVASLETASCSRSPLVWDALYRVVLRIASGERGLMDDPLDEDTVRLARLEKDVRRDAHKMHAFVRFRRIADESARNGERFVAWYRPSHIIVRREASFFRRRFPSMDWSILTPDGCVHWDGKAVKHSPGVERDAAPSGDELEELWCTYYASIFNPARVKVAAMTAEMPRKFWDTLPETAQIPELLADVPRRLQEMAQNSRRNAESAAPFVPPRNDVDALAEALSSCEGCELHRNGTRPVAGEGPVDAAIALLGEQPGDVEEQAGRPFVGPAGEELDRALSGVGLERDALYVTNAVKHFRHRVTVGPRGKRRLHARPTVEHVSRCQPWLDAEMRAVRPLALVCLGVTASRAVFGPTFRGPIADEPPVVRSSRYARATIATFHPAAVLRARSEEDSGAVRAHIASALALAAAVVRGAPVRFGAPPPAPDAS